MVIYLKKNFARIRWSWQRCHWKGFLGTWWNFYPELLTEWWTSFYFPYAQSVLWHVSLSHPCASALLTDLLLLVFCFLCKRLNAFVSCSAVGLNLLDREGHLLPNATPVGCTRPSSQPETSNPSSFRAYPVCPWGSVSLAYSITVFASTPQH